MKKQMKMSATATLVLAVISLLWLFYDLYLFVHIQPLVETFRPLAGW